MSNLQRKVRVKLKKDWNDFILGYAQSSSKTIESLVKQADNIERIALDLSSIVKSGGRIYSCGNGGSACDSMHLTEELVARYLRDRPGIAAQHLQDSATITCWSNDHDYSEVFSRQVETLVKKEDALILFSTSGNSENIIKAAKKASEIRCLTIAFTGKEGGELKDYCKHNLIVQSGITSHIQEAHITTVHMICDILEQELFF